MEFVYVFCVWHFFLLSFFFSSIPSFSFFCSHSNFLLLAFPLKKNFLFFFIFLLLEAHVCFLLSRHKRRGLLVTHRIIYAQFSIQKKKKKYGFDPYFYSSYPQETEDFHRARRCLKWWHHESDRTINSSPFEFQGYDFFLMASRP